MRPHAGRHVGSMSMANRGRQKPQQFSSKLLNRVKENGSLFLHIVPFSKWLLWSWSIAFDIAQNGAEAGWPSPVGFSTQRWDVWQDEIVSPKSDCCTALPSYWIVALHLSTSSADSPTLFSSFPPLQKKKKRGKKRRNGFYLMFFLLSHFPICGPICQCHLCLTLRECRFTPANRVLLTTDDDVDRGDGLYECKFIYVAFQPPQPSWNTHVCSVIKTKLHFGPFTRSSLMCKFPI